MTKKKLPLKPAKLLKPEKVVEISVEVESPAKSVKRRKPASKNHYVDSKRFAVCIKKFYKDKDITDELAEMISKIANRLAFAPNFVNYTYREEMVGDAIVKMFTALKNKKFDPTKGNPFSYFTKIAFNAFCNRIKKEKKTHDTMINYQQEVYDTLIERGYLASDSGKSDIDSE